MPAAERMRRVGRRWRLLVGMAGLGVAAWVLDSERSQLSGSVHILAHANVLLGLAALGLETASDVAWGLMGYSLLPPTASLGRGRYVALSLAALAITNSIPFGAGASALYVIAQLQDAGLDAVTATSLVAATNMVAIATLVALFAAVLVLRAPAATVLSGADDVAIVTLGVLVLLGLGTLDRLVAAVLHATRALARRVSRHHLEAALTRVAVPRIPRASLTRSLGWGLANWLFDFATLLTALAAVGAHVGLAAAASAYVVGALATNLPITPGGLGIVEGSITVALVAFGGAPASMFAAVVLYRIASFWVWLPVGWGLYFWLARRTAHA
jgi:uncharacterized protein (TIRG00374 family)